MGPRRDPQCSHLTDCRGVLRPATSASAGGAAVRGRHPGAQCGHYPRRLLVGQWQSLHVLARAPLSGDYIISPRRGWGGLGPPCHKESGCRRSRGPKSSPLGGGRRVGGPWPPPPPSWTMSPLMLMSRLRHFRSFSAAILARAGSGTCSEALVLSAEGRRGTSPLPRPPPPPPPVRSTRRRRDP
jgi:hypothetical protein